MNPKTKMIDRRKSQKLPIAHAKAVSDRFKARASQKTKDIAVFMKEPHPFGGDYMLPTTLGYAAKKHPYDKEDLDGLVDQITCPADFEKLLEDYYDPDNFYGNYDEDGTRNTEQPMMSIIYHLEWLYSRIYTDNTSKTQIYALCIHARLMAGNASAQIVEILTHYFQSLNDSIVRQLKERGYLSIFVERLVEEHFKFNGGEEAVKMLDFLNDLHGSYETHCAWVIGSVINVAFSPLGVGRYHFTPGPCMHFYQSIVSAYSHQIKIATPADEVIASLVRVVVMARDIGLDGFCRSALEQYLPTTHASLQTLHTISGVGVEYLQNWMTILEERLAMATVRSNLTEAFSHE